MARKFRFKTSKQSRKGVAMSVLGATVTGFQTANMVRDYTTGVESVNRAARDAKIGAAFKIGHMLLGNR